MVGGVWFRRSMKRVFKKARRKEALHEIHTQFPQEANYLQKPQNQANPKAVKDSSKKPSKLVKAHRSQSDIIDENFQSKTHKRHRPHLLNIFPKMTTKVELVISGNISISIVCIHRIFTTMHTNLCTYNQADNQAFNNEV
jgi:hypothetical protein